MPDPKEVFDHPENHWALLTATSDTVFEGQHFDRKEACRVDARGNLIGGQISSLKGQIQECLSGFANVNRDGGLLVLGITKEGAVKGTNHLSEQQLNSLLDLNSLLVNHSASIKFVDCITLSSAYQPTLGVGIAVSRSNPALALKNTAGPSLLVEAGSVGIGTASPATALHVVGDVTVTGNIAAKYQDVAEWVPARQVMPAGTVVVLDAEQSNQVMASSRSYDTRVAGVVSARPGLALGEGGAGKVLVATTGRVRVKVDATRTAISIGDLLVTSDKEGLAMKSEPVVVGGRPFHSPGTLIGKALEPLAKGTTGEILVLLSLQ